MNALVLGGSVFVGKHMVETLLSRGIDVSVLNRGVTPTSFSGDVELLKADRTDLEQMRAALAGRQFDAVYDVSGFVMAAGGSDIEGLVDLVDGRVGSYVYVSSIMAYDQSQVGIFPWTEDLATNPEGASSYGGFKALAETAMLARWERSGFPVSVVRPAAIYGPDNNIFDMETPMFLRLLQGRPILVPHGGLVVGSFGHVDDLCEAMVTIAAHPATKGQVYNISGDSLDVNRYISVLSDLVGRPADVRYVDDQTVAELAQPGATPVYGHLFKVRHHAMLSCAKAARDFGFAPRYDVVNGHRDTLQWFFERGMDAIDGPLADPVWKASWDFQAEQAVADRIARG